MFPLRTPNTETLLSEHLPVPYVRFDCKLQSFGKSSNRITVTFKCKEITKFEINFVMFDCQTKFSFLLST